MPQNTVNELYQKIYLQNIGRDWVSSLSEGVNKVLNENGKLVMHYRMRYFYDLNESQTNNLTTLNIVTCKLSSHTEHINTWYSNCHNIFYI